MPLNPIIRILAFTILAVLLTGCLVVPIPSMEESIVFGSQVADNEVRSRVTLGQTPEDVEALLGEPIVDLGPQRVFVYQWVIDKGGLLWVLPGGVGGIPVTQTHLFLVAFGSNGKVLKTGTTELSLFDTISEHVREWLSLNGLTAQVEGPRLGQSGSSPLLFVYRKSSSLCSFPGIDFNPFKSSVAVDGRVVGDLAKGEYLGSEISAGPHVITLDPAFNYQATRRREPPVPVIQTSINIIGEPSQPIYIEIAVCTGSLLTPAIEMHAKVRDAVDGLQAIRGLKSAW